MKSSEKTWTTLLKCISFAERPYWYWVVVVLQIRIRIILGSLIRIPTEVKIQELWSVKIQELWRVKMEPWTLTNGRGGSKRSLGRSVAQWSQVRIIEISRIRNPFL